MKLGKDSGEESVVAVVDADDIGRKVIECYLRESGYTNIVRFADGNQAWEQIRQNKFDLVIMDWILPGASGLAVFNRIRRLEQLALLPVIVLSAQLDQADFSLLHEFPCTSLVEKPLAKAGFTTSMTKLTEESDSYSSQFELIDTFFSSAQIDGEGTEALFKKLWKKLPNPVPISIMGARILRAEGHLDLAEKILRKVMDSNHKIIPIASELGKVLLLKGETAEATRVLNHAQSYSSKNVERLLLLGETHLRELQPDKAQNYFSSVLEIDPRDRKAYHGKVVAKNMSEHVAAEGRGGQIPTALASMLNAVGIKKVRNKEMKTGIGQYEAAMSFVYSNHDRSRLAFNTGLGYLRWGKPKRALPWFQKSAMLGGDMTEKARRYIKEAEKLLGKKGSDEDVSKVVENSTNPANAKTTDEIKILDYSGDIPTVKTDVKKLDDVGSFSITNDVELLDEDAEEEDDGIAA